jgi:chemotaxis regulatin CheY-phosphate phosphatase CheZ
MDTRQATALAGELETTLALLQDLVAELGRVRADWTGVGRVQELLTTLRKRPELNTLPRVLLAAYTAISDALSGIRLTREAIHSHTVQRLHDSHSKLSEVSSATESATMEMMNGLERSLAIIAEIQTGTCIDPRACDRLRDEVNQMFNHLQFQDITAQQLAGVAQFLDEIELRIAGVVGLFDHALAEPAQKSPGAPVRIDSRSMAFNPDASPAPDAARQAQIDAAFAPGVAPGRIPA